MRSLKLNDVACQLSIRVYCKDCKAWFDPRKEKGKMRKKPCLHPASRQVYKSTIIVPSNGSKRKRKSLEFKTRDLGKVILEGLKFKQYIKLMKPIEIPIDKVKPPLLVDCLAMFLDFKHDVGVKGHQKRNLSKNMLSSFKNYIMRWQEATVLAGEEFSEIEVDKVSDHNVQCTIEYLNSWGSSMQRKTFGFYNEFYRFLMSRGYNLISPFKDIEVSDNVEREPRAVTFDEFSKIKTAMENGSSADKVKGKIRYYDWLCEAMDFAVFTGRRREEYMIAKFSDIHLIEGNLLGGYIKMIDSKYSKQNKHKIAFKPRFTKAPIYPELYDLLVKLGYDKYKNTDRYIVASNSSSQRDTLANNLTNAFKFYREQVDIEPEVELNGLRKKYITRMRNEYGDNANFFTGHSDSRIDKKHYYDDKELFKNVKDFKLWQV